MIEKPLDAIEAADLVALSTRQVTERRTLDYKRDLRFASRDERKEFVSDVLSFANASGGDIVFGMDEAKDAAGGKLGYPEPPLGTSLWAADDEVKRAMEQCVRDSSDPRLPSIDVKIVDGGFTNGKVVVVRVPKSPAGPHVSLMDQRFYSRATTGKYPLDVRQLRSAFVDASELERAARSLRSERLALIDSRRHSRPGQSARDELPRTLNVDPDEAVLTVHVVASSFVDRARRLEVSRLDWKKHLPEPGRHMHLAGRYNLDGLVLWTESNHGSGESTTSIDYWQVFRAGAVEYVNVYHPNRGAENGLLLGDAMEVEALEAVHASTRLLASGGADYPMFVFVALLNVRGRTIVLAKAERDRFAKKSRSSGPGASGCINRNLDDECRARAPWDVRRNVASRR
ncbi:MAG: ATP-binding protein [Labilithrix sp.]